MRLLVTGLCLQGNKGGPALALSLRRLLQDRLGNVELVFSVPPEPEAVHERRWAQRYGVEVVEDFSYRDLVPGLGRGRRLAAWWRTLRRSTAVVEMSAISYIGPPARPWWNALVSHRRRYFLAARLARRPLLAWTQSYGPFSTPLVRWLARRDLLRQPIVFCRGEDCRRAVEDLLPGARAEAFPDVAVVLPTEEAGAELAAAALPETAEAPPRPRVTVSPSSVLYGKSVRSGGNAHVDQMAQLCRALQDRGYEVLLVPHTLRPGRPDPRLCDRAVAQEILDCLGEPQHVGLLRDDLSPMALKAVIATARLHIGGRYHSIVAALSSGVPAISLSWHPKYLDLMRYFDFEDFVFEGTEAAEPLLEMVEEIDARHEELVTGLVRRRPQVIAQVQRNADLFVEHLRHAAGVPPP